MSTVAPAPPATPDAPDSTAIPEIAAVEEQLGRPIEGPTAIGGDWHRLAHLTWTLGTTDFKLKFFGSVLGYLWQIMRPLLMFGVLFVVFSVFLRLGNAVEYYPVALLLGIVLYTFLNESTSGAVTSLVSRETLVRKVQFPRLAVPLSVVLTALFNLGLNLLPVFVFLLILGGTPMWSWLELPALFALLAVFALGLSMMLSALFVRYRDVEPIWDVSLQTLFYASPVIYPIDLLLDDPKYAELGEWLVRLNPFAAILQQARHDFIAPSHMTAAEAVGGTAWLLVPATIIVAVVIVGFRVFERAAPGVAEEL